MSLDLKIGVVNTTFSDKSLALKIAEDLIKNNLAKCVQIKVISSIYSWQGEIKKSEEFEVKCKFDLHLKEKIISFLKENHEYKIPQILLYEAYTDKNYYNYIIAD